MLHKECMLKCSMSRNYALYPFKQILYMKQFMYVKTPLCMKIKHDQTYTKALLIDLQIQQRKKNNTKKNRLPTN